jgi:hypothetical protein
MSIRSEQKKKKKVLVDEGQFNIVLGRILSSKPLKRKDIKIKKKAD